MKQLLLTTLFLCTTILFAQQTTKPADAILGKWVNENKDLQVEVYKDAQGKYCSKIIWFKVITKGKTINDIVDKHNPNINLRTRKWLGLQALSGLEYCGNNIWDHGTIYSPKKGKTYSAKCTLKNINLLEVRGYIGLALLGETLTFIRVK
jgi:uncharacterized protein (DUF2147 family)